MIKGSINRIDLGTSSFERIIENGGLYVDKTRLVENFLNESSQVHLITRHRRLGKSLNMNMLKCFLTDRADFRHLFKGLYIENSPVWEKANSAPVFYFDFKGLTVEDYKLQIQEITEKYAYSLCEPKNLDGYAKRCFDRIIDGKIAITDSLRKLTEFTHELTGKRSYILIDEYDKILMDNHNSPQYEEIRNFMTLFFSAGVKGNEYLEKALLTGVMRISKESLFSGLNNILVFDVFDDNVYTDDYGFTETEIDELQALANFDKAELKTWYNGIMVNGHAIYNTYSVATFLKNGKYDCHWTMSGVMDIIAKLLNEERMATLARLLNGERILQSVDKRISLKGLSPEYTLDRDFYSLLVQAGYLAVEIESAESPENALVALTIPNKELMLAWKDFILKYAFKEPTPILNIFRNSNNAEKFAEDLQDILDNRMSYHDFLKPRDEPTKKALERTYQQFMLILLCAYGDSKKRYPTSNRESGDGRYDVFIERKEAYYIFELKSSEKAEDLADDAAVALRQINEKRYGVELDENKRLVRIGLAFFGKQCAVVCEV
ncbi:MAG: ATP-binding protein [Turicibacter sp.]|nr:ATP-binding protein [Turicibacter sp.]